MGNNTGLGTPRRSRLGSPWPRPCVWGPGQGNPRPRKAARGGALPPWPPGTPGTPNPSCLLLKKPAFGNSPARPALTAQGRSYPNHLPRCSASSRDQWCDGCSTDKAANKVIEIEATPRASDPGFLLKWLQGQRRGVAPRAFPAAAPRQRPGPAGLSSHRRLDGGQPRAASSARRGRRFRNPPRAGLGLLRWQDCAEIFGCLSLRDCHLVGTVTEGHGVTSRALVLRTRWSGIAFSPAPSPGLRFAKRFHFVASFRQASRRGEFL